MVFRLNKENPPKPSIIITDRDEIFIAIKGGIY